MALRFRSERELKKILNIPSSSCRPLREDNATDEVYKQAVQTIRHIQSIMHDLLSRNDIELKLVVKGKTRADIDNIFKGVADSLQGLVYENDKQIKKGSFEHKN